MKKYIVAALLFYSFLIKAQNTFIISGGNVKVTNNANIHLKNTTWKNDGNFDAGNGNIVIEGDAVTGQSLISGAQNTEFYNLVINKSSNNAKLAQSITVKNNLRLEAGKLEIANYNLNMSDNATFSNINKDRYIQTNGTGVLKRKVGNSFVVFPVGKATFNPARLKNDGAIDLFSIRVEDHFLQNGTSGNAITANVIPKTWFIDEATPGGSDVTMRLIWRPAHNGTGFDLNTSQITHYTGGNWQDLGAPTIATDDNTFSSDHKYREANNITNFSPFGVKSASSLPVELLYFYGEKQGEQAHLSWETATEINNSHFDVEWSKDGINFTKIGEVGGAGTTNEIQFYEWLHKNPVNGQNYYRLKQIDLPDGQVGFDGKYEYTNTISVDFNLPNKTTLKVYPNPATYYFEIESNTDVGANIQIFNIKGQLIAEYQHEAAISQISTDELINGTYFIKINNQVQKVIIQK